MLILGFPVGAASAKLGLGAAVGAFAAGAYTLVVIAALTLPETRGRELRSLAKAQPPREAEGAAT